MRIDIRGRFRYNEIVKFNSFNGPVAQLDRALDFESIGRGFESLRGHHCNHAFAGSAEAFLCQLGIALGIVVRTVSPMTATLLCEILLLISFRGI